MHRVVVLYAMAGLSSALPIGEEFRSNVYYYESWLAIGYLASDGTQCHGLMFKRW